MSDIGRALLIVLAVLLFPAKSYANQAYNGFCQDGGVKDIVQGISSTNFVQGSFPGCTVTVNVHGGGLATIFGDNIGTPKANPFTASLSDGSFVFYVANGRYDVNVQAVGLNYTYSDVLFSDPATNNIAPVFTSSTQEDGQPRQQNPAFEGPGGVGIPPPGWANNQSQTAAANLTAGTTLAYETVSPAPGKLQSLKMTTTVQGAQLLNNEFWSVIPGDSYTLRCQVKSDGTGIPNCNVTFRTSTNASAGECVATGTTSTSWSQITQNCTVPVNADYAFFRVYNSAVTQPSSIWLDTPLASRDSFPLINSPAPNTDLTLSETGDVSGPMKAHVRNRPGGNGVIIEDPNFVVTDLGLTATAVITNIAIDAANNLTVTAVFNVGGSTLPTVGQDVTLSGLTTATFLNGQTVFINSITATQFTATFVHAAYTSAPDTGLATIQANVRGEFRNDKLTSSLNTTGEVQVIDPFGIGGAALKWLSIGRITTAAPNNMVAAAFDSNSLLDRQPILQNPSFENQRGAAQPLPGPTGPAGWIRNHGNETLTIETTTQAPNKNQSLKISTIDVNGGIAELNFHAVLGGDIISTTNFGKADGSSTVSLLLCWYDKTGTNISCNASSSTSTSWAQLAVSGTAPATAIAYNLACLNTSVTQPSTVWCDEFSGMRTSVQTGGLQTPWYIQRLDAGNVFPQIIGGSTGAGVGWILTPVTSGATQKSWFTVTNQNKGGQFELIPSTTNGGITPAATDAFSLDVNGNGLFGGVMSVGGTVDNGISRIAADVGGFGNGTAGDVSGDWRVGVLRVQIGTPQGIECNGPIVGCSMGSSFLLSWTSGNSNGTQDTTLWRSQANVIGVGNGTNNLSGFMNMAGLAINRLNASNLGASLSFDTTGTYRFGSASVIGFTSGLANAAIDTGASRNAAGIWFFGNGTQNDHSATIGANKVTDDGSGNFFRLQNVSANEATLWNGGTFGWSASSRADGTRDTGLTRVAAHVVGVGTGAAGDVSGTLDLTTLAVFGATAGNTQIQAPATTSGTNTLQAVTDTFVYKATTDTLTNKRITPRIVSLADATSITPTSDTADENIFSSSQAAGTLTVNAPSGTPTDGQKLILRLKATNAQTYSFNATYHFSTSVSAPATLAAGKTDYIGLIFNNAASVWDVVAVDQGHTD